MSASNGCQPRLRLDFYMGLVKQFGRDVAYRKIPILGEHILACEICRNYCGSEFFLETVVVVLDEQPVMETISVPS